MSAAQWLLLAELAASVWMAALIWIVQLLIYPAFADVSPDRWAAHHARHSTRITWLVLPPMLVQLAAPAALLTMGEPDQLPRSITIALLTLAVLTWALTAAVSAPSHTRLGAGFTDAELRTLLRGNWARTAAWSAITALAVFSWISAVA